MHGMGSASTVVVSIVFARWIVTIPLDWGGFVLMGILGGFVPTGENRGKGFGWGAYRTKLGKIIVARSNTPRSVSMTPANSDYYDSLDKGHKSAMVNRAMDNYRGDGFTTHELLANIEALQNHLREMYDENPPGPVAPESTPRMGGLRAILARMWPF